MCLNGIYLDLFFAQSLSLYNIFFFLEARTVGVLGPKQKLFVPCFAPNRCVCHPRSRLRCFCYVWPSLKIDVRSINVRSISIRILASTHSANGHQKRGEDNFWLFHFHICERTLDVNMLCWMCYRMTDIFETRNLEFFSLLNFNAAAFAVNSNFVTPICREYDQYSRFDIVSRVSARNFHLFENSGNQ